MVPSKCKIQGLIMLHQTRPGIASIKNVARGYVCCPGIDEEVEMCVHLLNVSD